MYMLYTMSDKKSTYKTCVVPECTNTSITVPDKLFISLPKDQKARRLWQHAMGRIDFVSDKGSRYCCEDHFNVEKDIENYMYIKTMKTGRIKMKSGVVPHIFDCQRNRAASPSCRPRKLFKKREQQIVMENSISEISRNELPVIPKQEPKQQTITSTITFDRGTQVSLKPRMQSKATQCTDSYTPS